MNTQSNQHNTHTLAWILASTILILAAIIILISAIYPAATVRQNRQSGSSQPTPAAQTNPIQPGSSQPTPASQVNPVQPGCQGLPECGYINAHTTGQSLTGSGPVGPVNAPVLTPACDGLPECGYIRAHIQANGGEKP
jgi:hypothetical protein